MLLGAQLGLAALACAVYGAFELRRRSAGEESSWKRRLCFVAGAVMIAAAVIALDRAARQLLYADAIQNLLIGDIAAMLLAVGLYRPESLSRGGSAAWRALRGALLDPRLALPLWAVSTFVWYLPGPHDAALRSESLHLLEHLLLLACGLIAWSALLQIVHASARLRVGAAIGYVLLWRMLQAVLGGVGVWSKNVYYHAYIHSEVTHAISPLADQGTAGAIMFGESALVAVCVILWLCRMLSRDERKLSPAAEGIDLPASSMFAVDAAGGLRRPPSQPAS